MAERASLLPAGTWPQLGGSGGGPEGGSPPVAWPELQGPQAASSGGWRGVGNQTSGSTGEITRLLCSCKIFKTKEDA